ncbi:hypothetical protein M9458_005772, partial [Cirrhinus mrigala]
MLRSLPAVRCRFHVSPCWSLAVCRFNRWCCRTRGCTPAMPLTQRERSTAVPRSPYG